MYGTCGTYGAALVALGTAITTFVGGFGLHETAQIGGWPEYFVGTYRDTQLACRAVSGQICDTQSAGRHYVDVAFRYLLVGYRGQTTVDCLFGGFGRCRSDSKSAYSHEVASTSGIDAGRGRSGFSGMVGNLAAACVAYSPLMTLVDAVHTCHTPGIVDRMVPGVDA